MKIMVWLLFLNCLFIRSIYSNDSQYKLLPYDAWDGEYTNEEGQLVKDAPVYKPYPVIFIHGFAGGGPDTWDRVFASSTLKTYYGPYADYSLENITNPFLVGRSNDFSYLERMNMQDKNGSIDTYNAGDEIDLTNEQDNSDGWADKLKKAIDDVILASGAEKVILVCHSMGGLAARELITNANNNYGDFKDKVDRVITISTPHAGSPLAKSAANLGRFYRHGWVIPGPGWVVSILIAPVKVFLQYSKSIDISGEAVRDMTPNKLEGAPSTPGSAFLEKLGAKRFEPAIPPIYTITASDGSKLPILLAENGAIAKEPTDGAVPLQSQRGYPFVRDSNDGVYLPDSNGNILTQSRMFSNPDKIDEEDFLDLSKALGIEQQITASHGGDNGAPFVAAGLIWHNNTIRAVKDNYIAKYIDYHNPSLSVYTSDDLTTYYGKRAFQYTFSISNVYLPASYETCWPYFGNYYNGSGLSFYPIFNATEIDDVFEIRPFENMQPSAAGFILPLPGNPTLITTNNYGYTTHYQMNIKIRNAAGIGSNIQQINMVDGSYASVTHEWMRQYEYKPPNSDETQLKTEHGSGNPYTGMQTGAYKSGTFGYAGYYEQKATYYYVLPYTTGEVQIRKALLDISWYSGNNPTYKPEYDISIDVPVYKTYSATYEMLDVTNEMMSREMYVTIAITDEGGDSYRVALSGLMVDFEPKEVTECDLDPAKC